MRRARLVSVGLVAAALFSAVAGASAFAEGPIWLVNGVKLEAGQKVETEGEGTLSFIVNGLSIKVECKKLTEKMPIFGGEPGTDEDVLQYSGCTVVEPVHCKVKEPIVIETDTRLVFLTKVGGKWKKATEAVWEAATEKKFGDEFKPKAGTTLFTVTFENSGGGTCVEAGKVEVKGDYTGLVVGGLEFSEASSEITVKEKPGYVSGHLNYWIVNEKGEKTSSTLEVAR